MKKRFLFAALIACSLGTLMADDYSYPYMLFTHADGTRTIVDADQLEITFSDGKLVAKSGSETVTLTLADLASMQFSTTQEGNTDVITLTDARQAGDVQYYDLGGRRVVQAQGAMLRHGTYIVRKADGSTFKMMVK